MAPCIGANTDGYVSLTVPLWSALTVTSPWSLSLAQSGSGLPEGVEQLDVLHVGLRPDLDVAAGDERREGVLEPASVATDLLPHRGLLWLDVASLLGLQQRLADLLHGRPLRRQHVTGVISIAGHRGRRRRQLHLDRAADPR